MEDLTSGENQLARMYDFEPLLTSREAAVFMRMHYKTLERYAREGRVPRHFFKGRWYFRISELNGWLKSQ